MLEAIRLEGSNRTAYGVLGTIYRIQNKWQQALITFQIALKHSPNNAQIHFWYGITLRSIGRLDEAIEQDTKAVSLDPLCPAALYGVIATCANAGRYDQAKKAIQDGQPLFNDDYMYHYTQAFYYVTLHDYRRASSQMHTCDSLGSFPKWVNPFRLYVRAKTVPKDHLENDLKNLALVPENYLSLAAAYAGLEDKENCLKYLQLAGNQNLSPDYLKVIPLYAFLHGDPRFSVQSD